MIKINVPRIILSLTICLFSINVQANEANWKFAQEGNKIILIRHSIAPGGGDPPGFNINDCETQRNLSQKGVAQSKKIGEFKAYLVLKIDNYVCYIDLRENQKIKKLAFGFDDLVFTRKQIVYKENLKNYLHNKKYNLKIKIPNPLTEFTNSYYKNLMNNCNTLDRKFIYENFKFTLKTYFERP